MGFSERYPAHLSNVAHFEGMAERTDVDLQHFLCAHRGLFEKDIENWKEVRQ